MSTAAQYPSPSPSLSSPGAYELLLDALFLIPAWHYALAFLAVSLVFLYCFLEFHLLEDALTGFRGAAVKLTFNPESHIYHGVVSRCRILHGRYLATPWLSSPHLQTCFLNFLGRPPVFSYRRKIFHASDGGTVALDWLSSSDVSWGVFNGHSEINKDDTTPIVIVIPGLTSDSASAYIKHLAFNTAKRGWNVVVANHRGLGGVSVTSDCFYSAGWTEDVRAVIDHLSKEYPLAPLFVIGTSIGANILVKFLGEDGDKVPVAGAVAICSPWDLLIGDRFICRRLVQKLYDRALTIGLQGYAKLHEPRYSRLANWEGIKQSRSIRDFDNYATCMVGKFETVDTYYRRCSSSAYVGNVALPLLCISALDDPVCSREAIPWDECRANKSIVLATTKHGGHLAFFEGLTASGLWWVRAANEFLSALLSSTQMHVPEKIQAPEIQPPLGSSIDQGPYVNVAADGMVAAAGNENGGVTALEQVPQGVEDQTGTDPMNELNETSAHSTARKSVSVMASIRRSLSQLCGQSRRSVWLLAYIALITSLPFFSSFLGVVFRKKRRALPPAALQRR